MPPRKKPGPKAAAPAKSAAKASSSTRTATKATNPAAKQTASRPSRSAQGRAAAATASGAKSPQPRGAAARKQAASSRAKAAADTAEPTEDPKPDTAPNSKPPPTTTKKKPAVSASPSTAKGRHAKAAASSAAKASASAAKAPAATGDPDEATPSGSGSRASKKRPAPTQQSRPAKAARVAAGTVTRRPAPPHYEDVWKSVYLAGTEWNELKNVYSVDWDFEHLDDALSEEGELEGKKVHLFGCTEPQLIRIDEKDEKGHVVPVPVIVAVVCDVAPPSTVGIKSVQRATEEIVPMSKLRMSWEAYVPPNVGLRASFKPIVHVLTCTQRKARLRNMGEEDVHRYDYVLPYFIDPTKSEEVDENTSVQVLADLEGMQAPLMCEFDYEMDDLSEFVETTLQEQELDEEKHTEPLKTAIREAVRATKLKYKNERLARQKMIDAIPREEKEAIKAMKLIKFYPANEWPDVSEVKSRFINRYYGHAHEVM